MKDTSEILNNAARRAAEMNLPYAGALLPAEAYELLQGVPDAKLIDVRTRAEWDFVGKATGSIPIEWQTYPGAQPNPGFLEQLMNQVSVEFLIGHPV